MCLLKPYAQLCCQRVIFYFGRIFPTEMSLSTVIGHGGDKTLQAGCGGPGVSG